MGTFANTKLNVAVQITKIQSANVSSLGTDVVLEKGIKVKIPKKIGGDLGQAIGQVTNPIRDAVGDLANGLEDSIQGEANQIADSSGTKDFDDCVTVTAAGLAAAGAAKGGPWGAAIGAGAGVPTARIACRRLFPG